MNIFMRVIGAILSFLLLFSVPACRKLSDGNSSDNNSEDSTSSGTTEESFNSYDWNSTVSNAYGTGGKNDNTGSFFSYVEAYGYFEETQTDITKNGIRYLSYLITLNGLKSEETESIINNVISTAEYTISADTGWTGQYNAADYGYPANAEVTAQSYISESVSVMGNILSINILYTRSFIAKDSDSNFLGETIYDEGRMFYNFDLNNTRALLLSDLFTNDADYMSLLVEKIKTCAEKENIKINSFDSLPEKYDLFCITESDLIIGFPSDNPYTGQSEYFALPLSAFSNILAGDPNTTGEYLDESAELQIYAFENSKVKYTDYTVSVPFMNQKVCFPLVSDIAESEKINGDLQEWYNLITSGDYCSSFIQDCGSISVEADAPAGLISITVFIYADNGSDYITIARCYNSETGDVVRVRDLIKIAYSIGMTSEMLDTDNFRVGYDFTIGIPKQEGIEEYYATETDAFNFSYFPA